MILGAGFSFVIFGAGWLVMRPLRLGKEPTSFGLAPALGFAALAAISAARAMFGFAPLLGTVAVVGIGVAGLTTAAVDAWGARLHVSDRGSGHGVASGAAALSGDCAAL